MGTSLNNLLIGVLAVVTACHGLGQSRRGPYGAGVTPAAEFDCPEEFGYYPHPTDCTQYYVCVFGGALLESCTGGLMYSHELQTCDWPRNVGCGAEGSDSPASNIRSGGGGNSNGPISDGRESRRHPVQQSQRTSNQASLERQKQIQQDEIAKHQLYADDLGPAEEVETDRQQRVYRGQPAALGQVARDRDGLRPQPATNTLQGPSGARDKVVVTYSAQDSTFSGVDPMLTPEFDMLFEHSDHNFLNNDQNQPRTRKKRQAPYRTSYPPKRHPIPIPLHVPQPARPSKPNDEMHKYKLVFDPSVPSTASPYPRYVTSTPKSLKLSAYIAPNTTPTISHNFPIRYSGAPNTTPPISHNSPLRYSGLSVGDLVPPPLSLSAVQTEIHPKRIPYRTIPADDEGFIPIADPSRPKLGNGLPNLVDKHVALPSYLASSHIQFQRFGPGTPIPLFGVPPQKHDVSAPLASPSSHVHEMKIPNIERPASKLQASQSYINERGEKVHGNYRDPQQEPVNGKTPLPPIPWVDERGKNHHLLLPPTTPDPDASEPDESKSADDSLENDEKQSSSFRDVIPDEPKLAHIPDANNEDDDFGPESSKRVQKPKVYDNETKSKIIISNSKVKTDPEQESEENEPSKQKQSQEVSAEGGETKDKEDVEDPNEGEGENTNANNDEEGQDNSNRQQEDDDHDFGRDGHDEHEEPQRTKAYSEELANFDYRKPTSQEDDFTKSPFSEDPTYTGPPAGFFSNMQFEDTKNPFADPQFDYDKYIETIAIEPSVNRLIGSLAKDVEENERMREAKLKGDLERTKGGEVAGGYEDEDRVDVDTPKPPRSKYVEEPFLWEQHKDKKDDELRAYDDKIFSFKSPFAAETHRELDFFKSGQKGKIEPYRESSSKSSVKSRYSNPFADPNFDFDEYLAKLQGTTTTTTTPKPRISESEKSRKRLLKAPGSRQKYVTRPRGRVKYAMKENNKTTEEDSNEQDSTETPRGKPDRLKKNSNKERRGEGKDAKEEEQEEDKNETKQANVSGELDTEGTTRIDNHATESSVYESTAPYDSLEHSTAYGDYPSESPQARPFSFESSTPRPFTGIRTDGSNRITHVHGGVTPIPTVEHSSFSTYGPEKLQENFEKAFALHDNFRESSKPRHSSTRQRKPTRVSKNEHFDVFGFSPEYSVKNVHLAPTESYEDLNPIKDIYPDDGKIGMSTEVENDDSEEDQSTEAQGTNKNENVVPIHHSDKSTSLRPAKSSVSFVRNQFPSRLRSSTPKDVTLFPTLDLSTIRPRLPATAASSRNTSRLRPQPFRQNSKERSPINLDSSPSEVRPVLPLPNPTPTTTPTSQRAGGTGVASDKDKSVTAGRQRYGPKTTSFNTDIRETTFLRTATTNRPSRTGSSGRVEPSISPLQFSTTSRPSYNNSYQHHATPQQQQHFDSYYTVYDEDPELYRDVGDYNHYQNNQGGNQPQPFSRAQNYGKQDDQRQQQNVEIITQPQQRQQQQQDTLPANNAYVTSSFNVQSQDYNDNYNAQVENPQYSPDDTFQPKTSSSIRHPNGLKRQTDQGSGSDSTPSQSEFKPSSPFPFPDFNQPSRFPSHYQNYQTSPSPSHSVKLEPEISTPSSRFNPRPLSVTNIPESFFSVGTPTPPTIRDSSEPSYYLRPPTARPFTFTGKDFSIQPNVETYSTIPDFQNSARPTNLKQNLPQAQFKSTGSVSSTSGPRSSTSAPVSSSTPSSAGHEVRILPKSQSAPRPQVEDSQARNSFSRYNYYPTNAATGVTPKMVTFPNPTTPSWLPLDYFASVFQQPPRLGSQLLKSNASAALKLAPETLKQSSPVTSQAVQAELQARLSPLKPDPSTRFKTESSPIKTNVQPSRSDLPSRHISSEQPVQTFISSTPDPARLRAFLQQQQSLDQISRLQNASSLEKSKGNNANSPSYATQDRVIEHKTPIVQTTFAQQTRDFNTKDYYQQARAFANDDQSARLLHLTRGLSTEAPVRSSSPSSDSTPTRYVSTEKPSRPEVPLTFVPVFDAQPYRSTQSPNSGSTLSNLAQNFFRPNNRPELEYITLQLPNKKQSYPQFRSSVSTGKPLTDAEGSKQFAGFSPSTGSILQRVTAPPTTTTTTSTTTTTTTTAKTPSTTSVSFEHYYYGSEEYADDYLEDDYEILQTDNGTEPSTSHPLADRVPSSTSRPTTTRTTESSLHAVRGSTTANSLDAQSIRRIPSSSSEHKGIPTGRGRPITFETLEIPSRDSDTVLKPGPKLEEVSISTAAPARNIVRSTTEAQRPRVYSTTPSFISSEDDGASDEVKTRGTQKSIPNSRESSQHHRQRISDSTTKNSEVLVKESTTARTVPITTYRSRKRILPKARPSAGSQNSEENETGFPTPSHSRRIRPRPTTLSPDSSAENVAIQRQAKRTRLTTSRNPGSEEDRSDASPENLVVVHRSKSKYVPSITASGDEGYSSEGVEDEIPLPRRPIQAEAVDQPTTFRSRSRLPVSSRSRLPSTETISGPTLKHRVSGLRNTTIDPPPTTYAPRVPFKVTTSLPLGVLPSSTSFENEVTPGDESDASKASLSHSIPLIRATVEDAADYASTNSTLTESSLTARAQLDSDSVNGGNDSTTKPILRLRPTTASPDSLTTTGNIRNNGRGRGKATYAPNAGEVNRGTPSSIARGTRPTLKPLTAIVSQAQEFVDIYKFPPTRPESVYPTPTVDKSAAKCRKDVCLLPDCNCGGKDIPGGFEAEQLPQIVLLTFDDAVNDLNKGLYADLFERGRVNPNGCPISATFYVSHEWTDYSQVQNLYADGHEMASHSVSHSFGEQFSQKKWTKEIAGQREILAAYGGVKQEDIRGMRAPFLAVGGNKMFKMLYDSNFTYDSSMPVYENKPPSWPYTLDYKLFHDCMIPPCPTRSYPGVWEVPMVMWTDLNGGRCSMGDACSNPPTSDGVYKMLIKNFERHYTTNRAPFGLFYHAAWFTQPHHKEGFIAFLDTLVNMPDVWLITNWQAIQWVRDPTPLSRINSFQPFQCNYQDRPRRCNNPKVCNLWHKSGVRYMRTCQPCPDVYPWTGKTGVRNSRVDNDISSGE